MTDDRTRTGAPPGETPPAERDASLDDTYSEQQVTEILRRTAQLERGRALQGTVLSLAEVEAIAREAGLDPSLVRLAARSLEQSRGQSSLATRLLGAPRRRTFERVLDGEISVAHHERLAADLREALSEVNHRPPTLSTVGRSLSVVSHEGGPGRIELTLTPRDGKTLLRIDVNLGPLAGAFFGALMGGLGGMTPAIVGAALATSLGPAGVALCTAGYLGSIYALARRLFTWRANALYTRMERLADRLEERLRKELASP